MNNNPGEQGARRSGDNWLRKLGRHLRSWVFGSGATGSSAAVADWHRELDRATKGTDVDLYVFALHHSLYADQPKRRLALDVLKGCVAKLSPRRLAESEEHIRRTWYFDFEPKEANSPDPDPLLLAALTLSPDGYARQRALQQLREGEQLAVVLPYLLLRLNDWVPQVREEAARTVRASLTPGHMRDWMPSLRLLPVLHRRTRVDHAWLFASLEQLLAREECRTDLLETAASDDPHLARWAIRAFTHVAPARLYEAISVSLRNRDRLTRTLAARFVRKVAGFPRREELLEFMRKDRLMHLRREALYAAAAAPTEIRRPALAEAMFDRHPSVRLAARAYLNEAPLGQPPSFDAAGFYRTALRTETGSRLCAAIKGLAETGTPQDRAELERFLIDPRHEVAVAARVALAGRRNERSDDEQRNG